MCIYKMNFPVFELETSEGSYQKFELSIENKEKQCVSSELERGCKKIGKLFFWLILACTVFVNIIAFYSRKKTWSRDSLEFLVIKAVKSKSSTVESNESFPVLSQHNRRTNAHVGYRDRGWESCVNPSELRILCIS